LGPLPTAPGNFKYAAVAVEYFSKWIEAKALRDITATILQKFFWQNIVCHFSVPEEVTVDNGKQFDYTTFREFCQQLGTKLCFASVYHRSQMGQSKEQKVSSSLESRKTSQSSLWANGLMSYQM